MPVSNHSPAQSCTVRSGERLTYGRPEATARPDHDASCSTFCAVREITDYTAGHRTNGNTDIAAIVRARVFVIENAVELALNGSNNFRLTGCGLMAHPETHRATPSTMGLRIVIQVLILIRRPGLSTYSTGKR
jgi:hypothetical protein